jgi:GT2 family glycosyltransferase
MQSPSLHFEGGRVSEVLHNGAQVAVIIPARNRSDLLKDCLSSLVEQDFPIGRCEVIVCDDHSEENLEEVVEMFQPHLPRLKLLRQQDHRGPATARNMGFRLSTADIFVCVDNDIICSPEFLGELVSTLESNPEWVAAEATLTPIGRSSSPLWDAPVGKGGVYLSGASAYRAEALRRAGGFDEAFPYYCEDTELAGRLLKLGKYGYVSKSLAYHPRRLVTLRTHWNWRSSWKYVMIVAKRYGFLAFPGKDAGRFPRLRVAFAAVVTQPAGRLIEGIQYMREDFFGGSLACFYALFDVLCGIWALPTILFSTVPPRRNYLIDKIIQKS